VFSTHINTQDTLSCHDGYNKRLNEAQQCDHSYTASSLQTKRFTTQATFGAPSTCPCQSDCHNRMSRVSRVRFSFQGAVVRYTVNSEVGGGKLKGKGTARQKTSAKRTAAEASSHTEGDIPSDATLERMRWKLTPMTDPEDAMRVVQGVIFNQPSNAGVFACPRSPRTPSLVRPSDKDKEAEVTHRDNVSMKYMH
jgi:hypothetical protein